MNIFPKIVGGVTDWDALVFGHLFWNRYLGETAAAPPRGIPSTCSSVVIRGVQPDGTPYCLIVDPTTRHSADEFYFDLNRRTGLPPDAVTHCFITHHHFDHWHGVTYFPNAAWLTGAGNAALIAAAVEESRGRDPGDGLPAAIDASRIREVSGEFLPGLYALLLPGHTAALHGIAFKSNGKRVLVAADAVMTKHHFADRALEFQDDPVLCRTGLATIDNIADSFDIVIPGHDVLLAL